MAPEAILQRLYAFAKRAPLRGLSALDVTRAGKEATEATSAFIDRAVRRSALLEARRQALPSCGKATGVATRGTDSKGVVNGLTRTENEMANHSAVEIAESVLADVDGASQALCCACDAANLFHTVHPDGLVRRASLDSLVSVGAFVADVNTRRDLHDALGHALAVLRDASSPSSSEPARRCPDLVRLREAARAAHLLYTESSVRGGTQLDPVRRSKYVTLQQEAGEMERVYASNVESVRGRTHNKSILPRLLLARAKMAEMLGFPSFAHMVVGDAASTVAVGPEAAFEFVTSSLHRLRFGVESAVALGNASEDRRHPTAARLPLEECIAVVDHACRVLFGVRVDVESERGVVAYAQDVRVVHLVDELSGESVATLFLDLFRRSGKSVASAGTTNTLGYGLTNDRSKPQMVMVMNLDLTSRQRGLVLHDVEVFWHEFGHVLHGAFSKTWYQHTSAARGPLDFIEFPSQLFERHVLPHFAALRGSAFAPPCKNTQLLDLHESLCYSGVDLLLHMLPREKCPQNWPELTDMVDSFLHEHSRVPVSTAWPRISSDCGPSEHEWLPRFAHISLYASNFYAYPFSRAIASAVWHTSLLPAASSGAFASTKLRAAGERLRRDCFQYGNSTEPRACVEALLGRDVLAPSHTADLAEELASEVL